ncbi:unnamed protein product [Closterium sp. Naga37s-1]|nr:unnamed protein product [Closterium sp. Naga37s-1]
MQNPAWSPWRGHCISSAKRGGDCGDFAGCGVSSECRVGPAFRGAELPLHPPHRYVVIPAVSEFPFTEPILRLTRAVIQPIGGVDIAPIVWLALISFLNEILLGQQGLLVLIANQESLL